MHMSNRTIRTVMVLAAISMLGLIGVQMFWVLRTVDLQQEKLDQSLTLALQGVSNDLADYYGYTEAPMPVEQVASDFFIVSVGSVIEADVLEHYLHRELQRHHLDLELQYGIYDCKKDNMKYGSYISGRTEPMQEIDGDDMGEWKRYVYYFGIRIPSRTAYLTGQMSPWVYSSILILVVVGFFGYTVAIILKQKRLSEIQKDFINTMSHEFMTPITSIGLAAEVLMKPETLQDPRRHQNYTGIIAGEIKRLRSLVENVLQHARLQKHGTNLVPVTISMDELLSEIIANFRSRVLERGGSLTFKNHCEGANVLADRIHLTGVIYNLLDNALKYSLETPQIEVTVEELECWLAIRVADRGMGIPKNAQKKIFDRFYRQPDSSLKNIKGFGLGLNYVQQIVRAHRWRMSLESEVGQGSTFTVWMKKLTPEPAPAAKLSPV